jgi:Alginate export
MNLALQAAATVRRWKQASTLACCGVLLGLTLGERQAAAQVETRPSGEMQRGHPTLPLVPVPHESVQVNLQPDRRSAAVDVPAGSPFYSIPYFLIFPLALDRPVQPGRPYIGLLRTDEDWSFLKDPANRTEFWDPLKYIELGKPGWYLSLGAETRQRYEIYHNFPFDPGAPSDDDGYYLMRYMLHGDLHLGPHLRLFTQFKSAIPIDKEALLSGADRNDLDVKQLFIEINTPMGETGRPFALRLGRQEFHYGMGRLLTIREGPNNRQGWDGLRSSLWLGNWRIEAFYALGVEDGLQVFDDSTTDDQMIWGLYATTMLHAFPGLGLDVYYLADTLTKNYFTTSGIRYFQDFVQGIGHETRHSVGTRVFGGRPPLDWDLEFILQTGARQGHSIWAHSISIGGGYTVPELPTRPRFTLGLDFVSGDRKFTDGDLQTFRPIVFRGNYSGEAAFLQLSNIIKVHPGVDLHLRRDMYLYLDFPFFWRMSRGDGLYSPGGFLVAAPIPSTRIGLPPIDDRYVGFQPSLYLMWQMTQYLAFNLSYAHFFSGAFLDKAGRGDADFGAVWFTYKF